MQEAKVCKRCVMSSEADQYIRFDEDGVCNYCTQAISEINTVRYFPGEEGKAKLEALISQVKETNKNHRYDCVMGISGGLDSSYLAYLGHKWGLRILGVHIDDGFDTEITKKNIKNLCSAANIELRVIKPDPEQYLNLIKAYMYAGVPNIAIPQDNILFAFLHKTVKEEKLKYFLSGGNFALECILQKDHIFDSTDTVNIRDINKKFGTKPIDKLIFLSAYRKYIEQKLGRVVSVRPLNYIDYKMERAFDELGEFCGFEYYGAKHLENILTAFIQLVWFPQKFKVDKRRSHLSSMIISGQISREEALKKLNEPLCPESELKNTVDFVKNMLGLSDAEYAEIMKAPVHRHEEYRTDKLSKILRRILS